MKGSDRIVLLVVPIVAALAAFWFLAVSPKRAEMADLDSQVADLQSKIDAQVEVTAFADSARTGFPKVYGKVVSLGKAAPSDADTASLLFEIQTLAKKSKITFNTLNSGGDVGEPPVPPAPVEGETAPAEGETAPAEGETAPAAPDPAAAVSPVAASEAAAAGLPIGAQIGPAGLPVMPYTLEFSGDFFEVADFLRRLDGLVETKNKGAQPVSVDGRLITVNGFSLEPDPTSGTLTASFTVATFLTPGDQGLTMGASPSGPALGAATDSSLQASINQP